MNFTFPKDFLFGAASSACQIEAGCKEGGKGEDGGEHFYTVFPEKYFGGDPAKAADFYHLYRKDILDMKELGLKSFRFSISWSRVLPQGVGQLNDKGMDYYKRVINDLNENGIIPNVTLYHWDLPQVLEDRGGWVNRDSIEWFGEYAHKMFSTFGDVVPMWSTVNEPIATYVGYAHGGFAPGYFNESWGNQARHNILVAHGKGVEAFRAINPKNSKIGVVIDIWKRHALTNSPEDIALMIDQDERNWKFYTDPILAGKYSDYILEHLEKEGTLMQMEPHDFELTGQPLDFFGLNVYNRVPVTVNQQAQMDFSQGGNFLNNRTEYYPKAVYDAIHLLHDLYDIKCPIYITENGCALPNIDDQEKECDDPERVGYLREHLRMCCRLIKCGYNLKGYMYWNDADSYEELDGYRLRFGLTWVDHKTGERRWKKSRHYFSEICKSKLVN